MEKIAFIDLEASGLGAWSWPIEVGWCFLEGSPESHLIKPALQWSLGAWDSKAEQLHGISYQQLLDIGEDAEAVCARLNDQLAGASVYSDAPDWDGFWLFRLFESAGVRQQFSIGDFGRFFSFMGRGEIDALIRKVSASAPHLHRAGADVLHMREIFSLARGFR